MSGFSFESKCSYGYQERGADGESEGWFSPCREYDETHTIHATVVEKKGIPFLQQLDRLKHSIGVQNTINYSNYDNSRETLVAGGYKKLTSVVTDVMNEFHSRPPRSIAWAHYSKALNWKVIRFLNNIMTESNTNKSFAIQDLYGSVYINLDTGEPALMPSENMSYSGPKFRDMVLDVCSIMLMFGNGIRPEHGKPNPFQPVAATVGVTASYIEYKEYLSSNKYAKYYARAAFNPPIFWTVNEQVKCLKDAFSHYKTRIKGIPAVNFEAFFDPGIDVDWMVSLNTSKSDLGTFYQKSMSRRNPPSPYLTRWDLLRFVSNALEHFHETMGKKMGKKDKEEAEVMAKVESRFNLMWNIFLALLEYTYSGIFGAPRDLLLSDLGF